ncbi:MAG: Zinc-binding GTPase YeiR [Candidatus Celerinatantimonas neptuna]|nr:MAG: Zinc-binding GTPase YeiR [Candidatus Celerinatantimonas neptuna]
MDVNLISVFLGSGKTSAINYLSSQKQPKEQWGILVNEFGKIGVDARLINTHSHIEICQISGGCLCCANGPAFTLSLEQLLSSQLQRILLEPTGLGHITNILNRLKQNSLVRLAAGIAIVETKQCLSPDYTLNEQWLQSLQHYQTIVLNKTDLCSPSQLNTAKKWLNLNYPMAQKIEAKYGQIPISCLTMSILAHSNNPICQQDSSSSLRIRRIEQNGQGYRSCGWKFPPATQFKHDALIELLCHYQLRRVKAHLNTDIGWRTINGLSQQLRRQPADSAKSAKLQLIHDRPLHGMVIEQALRKIKTG